MNYMEVVFVVLLMGILIAMTIGAGASAQKMARELVSAAASHESELEQLLALIP